MHQHSTVSVSASSFSDYTFPSAHIILTMAEKTVMGFSNDIHGAEIAFDDVTEQELRSS